MVSKLKAVRLVHALVALVALGGPAVRADAGAGAEPARLLAEVRSPALDSGRAVMLRDTDVALGQAVFHIDRGFLFPARTHGGRLIEWVFIGQATFRLEPPDEIEAGQVELFTGERSLEAPVEEAVLVLGRPDGVTDRWCGAVPRELRPEQRARAEELYRSWLSGPVRKNAGVEAAVFASLAGDEALSGYVALWCRSFELGDFLYQIDPEEAEPVTVAAFHGLTLGAWDRARLKHQIRVEQRKGRFLDTRVEDLGAWDVWLSTADRTVTDATAAGTAGFEAERYELDAKLARRGLALDGRARIDLRAQADGRRVVRLDLARDLRVRRVADERGRELFFARSGSETLVLLPEPSRAGERLRLDITWSGRVLSWVEGRYHDLDDTRTWYPHCGAVDRATYDVTLRWPAKYQVLAGGRVVDSGRDGDYVFERRKIDLPAVAFSFAVGAFDVERTQVGHVALTVGFHRGSAGRTSADLRRRTVETVARSLEYFEGTFGPYPLDELTVVTVPRSFSQSFLGFVALGERLITRADALGEAGLWFRNMTVAHELAHQWWGNLVGWKSYRDQWLSEGMANYAALLFDGHTSGDVEGRLAALSAGWREALGQGTPSGRTVESFGPVVLGSRLNSSVAPGAYRPIVYRKGAVILAMLARAVGEETFLSTLRSIVAAAANDVVTTDSFLAAIERASGIDLAGFARQFVYGTGIPEVYYGYEARPSGNGWTVEGEARFLESPRWRFEIVRGGDGRFDVRRRAGRPGGAGPTGVVVPYTLTLDRPGNPADRDQQSGQLSLDARQGGFEIPTALEPVDLRLDPRGEILAWFYSVKTQRKRVLRYEAEDRLAEGRLDEAEALYHEVLGTPAESAGPVDPLGRAPTEPRVDREAEDLRANLGLARLNLVRGNEERARTELDAIDAGLEKSDRELFLVERDVLRARIEMRRGEPGAALRRLKRTLRLASTREPMLWPDLAARARLGAEHAALAEGWALLAVAANELGRESDVHTALIEARTRGVDTAEFARARVLLP